jgi:acetyl/propionyl-CoA carboxylase alpha subunit
VRLADEAWPLEGNTALETYLRVDRILEVVARTGADAVHPGYGFLAEHAGFAAACRDQGIIYVGPPAGAIEIMGSKTAARAAAVAAGVPVVPGSDGPLPAGADDVQVAAVAERVGYPLLIKAVAGGGGKGMRRVDRRSDLTGAVRAARSEARSAFGDENVYLERLLVEARHVEVQLLADAHGTVLPFVERECSVQRRHQKVVEESPSVAVTAELRRQLAAAAVGLARAVAYTNAGTIEFLLSRDGTFSFLEMNTRLQVEHPVTEMVTGIDLVEWQLRIAAGEPLSIDPEATLTPRGHAIETRIYAEDPDVGFLPSPGRVAHLRRPSGPGVREDSSLDGPGDVPVYYDPLISKLIVWGADRARAVARLARALGEFEIDGVQTTLPFFRWLVGQEAFVRGEVNTGWLDRVMAERRGEPFAAPGEDALRSGAIAIALAHRSGADAHEAVEDSATTRGRWQLAARSEALR